LTETVYFVAGLPRSGSTLLCNLLCQNPRFLATGTSGVAEVLRGIKDGWQNVSAFRAMDNGTMYGKLRQTLRAVLFGYYGDVEQPVVFDKSRAWPAHIEMLKEIVDPVRVLVTVRNLADVMASWELRYRATMALGKVHAPKGVQVATLENRLKWYGAANHPIGAAFNAIKDAFARGHGDVMHVVEFERLTETPRATLAALYEWLGEEPYGHDFGHVVQVTREDDREHGLVGLHQVRGRVEAVPSRWREVLGDLGTGIAKQRCW
jgi:sulfotransferase